MPTTINNTQLVFNDNTFLETAAPGMVAFFAMNSTPAGWLKANGAALSTTTYANLFAVVGYLYGGSGGTFNLPDMRAEFPRFWDDGRGVDSGRGIGTSQGGAMRNLTGTLIGSTTAGESKTFLSASGAFSVNTTPNTTGKWENFTYTAYSRLYFNASNQVPTAAEYRPTNVALLACIKF
jgi:microcystin-dependent protein